VPGDSYEAPGTTYPYDGGPRTPVPMPRADDSETGVPRLQTPARERVVSTPAGTGKWAYPAYGEAPRRTQFAQDRVILTRQPARKSAR
jgi:hypothetical protein